MTKRNTVMTVVLAALVPLGVFAAWNWWDAERDFRESQERATELHKQWLDRFQKQTERVLEEARKG